MTLLHLVVKVTHRPRDIRSFTINLNPNLPIGIRKLNYDQEESNLAVKVTRKISNLKYEVLKKRDLDSWRNFDDGFHIWLMGFVYAAKLGQSVHPKYPLSQGDTSLNHWLHLYGCKLKKKKNLNHT